MGRIYTVAQSFTLANAGGDADLVEISPAANKPCKIVSIEVSQTSEVAEAQEEGLRLTLVRVPATLTSGSGGSTATVQLPDRSLAAVGFAAEFNNTTLATTSGTLAPVFESGWNERATPYRKEWVDPATRPSAINGEALCLRSATTPADDMTLQVTVEVEEEG